MLNWYSVVSLVTSVVNIVVPHALLGICAVYMVSNLHISLLLTGNYNVCKIHSFILVCGCSLLHTKIKEFPYE